MTWRRATIRDVPAYLRSVGGEEEDIFHHHPDFVEHWCSILAGAMPEVLQYPVLLREGRPTIFTTSAAVLPTPLRQWCGHFGLGLSSVTWQDFKSDVGSALHWLKANPESRLLPVIATTPIYSFDNDGGPVPEGLRKISTVNSVGHMPVLLNSEELMAALPSARRRALRKSLDWFEREVEKAGLRDVGCTAQIGPARSHAMAWMRQALHGRPEAEYIWPYIAAAEATAAVYPQLVLWVTASGTNRDGDRVQIATAGFMLDTDLNRVLYMSMVVDATLGITPAPSAVLYYALDFLKAHYQLQPGSGGEPPGLDLLNDMFPAPLELDRYKRAFYTGTQERAYLAAMDRYQSWPFPGAPAEPYLTPADAAPYLMLRSELV